MELTILINHQLIKELNRRKKLSAVEQKESAYDEVKPNCAETAISLKSNIVYTTVKHTSVL